MILEFNFGNVYSFKKTQTLNMLTWTNKNNEEHTANYRSYSEDKLRVLKSWVIFWQNAWWKTNVLKAMDFMKKMVLFSHRIIANDNIKWVEPFKLDPNSKNEPISFELKFISKDNIRYHYSFSLDNKRFLTEKLIAYYSAKPTIIIERGLEAKTFINTKIMKWVEGIKSQIRENNLVLSVLADKNIEEAKNIHLYFSNIHVFLSWWIHPQDTMEMLEKDPKFKHFLLQLLKDSDIWISNIVVENKVMSFKELPLDVKNRLLSTPNIKFTDDQQITITKNWFTHNVFSDWKLVWEEIFLENEESRGTMQIYILAWSIYDVMKNWKVLFIDEIDKSIHPKLLKWIVKMFHKGYKNLWDYQFIFNTHDISLLDLEIFRRDQIRFAEKNKYGESSLYSLLEFKERKDSWSIESNYIKNKYWATPFVWEFDNLFD
jgi:uncharacterized protein